MPSRGQFLRKESLDDLVVGSGRRDVLRDARIILTHSKELRTSAVNPGTRNLELEGKWVVD